MTKFAEPKPKKLRVRADSYRKEHAVTLIPGVPLRIHAPNGGYLFSVYSDGDGHHYRFNDKRWGDVRKIHAVPITWEKPV